MSHTTSDAQLSDWTREDTRFVKKMTHSQLPADRRLINLYKIRRAETRKTFEEVKAEEMAE